MLCAAQHEIRRKKDNGKENIFLLPLPSVAVVNFPGIGELQKQREAALESQVLSITLKCELQGTPKDVMKWQRRHTLKEGINPPPEFNHSQMPPGKLFEGSWNWDSNKVWGASTRSSRWAGGKPVEHRSHCPAQIPQATLIRDDSQPVRCYLLVHCGIISVGHNQHFLTENKIEWITSRIIPYVSINISVSTGS